MTATKPMAWGLSLLTLLLILSCVTTGKYKPAADPAALTISLADPLWDGEKIPDGQQCQRFGGHGATPAIVVGNIPDGANAVVMEFSDRSHQPMNNGGHGKIGFGIDPGMTEVTVPSVPGHTFDLPEGFFLVAAHRNPSWDKAGAYMPPCSGGRGNLYVVTVKAVYDAPEGSGDSKMLGKGTLPLGRY